MDVYNWGMRVTITDTDQGDFYGKEGRMIGTDQGDSELSYMVYVEDERYSNGWTTAWVGSVEPVLDIEVPKFDGVDAADQWMERLNETT